MQASVVVIGAGHAGLAMSRCLSERSIDHVVLERGEVANSWRTERWESLRLLTPNWQSRLPGYRYEGPDPDGFRTMPETVAFIERYAHVISAPVQDHTRVTSLTRTSDGYAVETTRGAWQSRAVVLATGACNIPKVPALAASMPSWIEHVTPPKYSSPSQLAPGGVLIVGASATGVQIADEIQRSGRQVTLSVGEHIRVPRTYRGRDIQWWMDAAGILDQRYDAIDDHARARNVPSLQLAGYPDRRSIDLNSLTDLGVRLVGRLAAVRDATALFSGSLANQAALSDLKMNRLLDAIDEWAASNGHGTPGSRGERFAPTRVPAAPPLSMKLGSGEVRTVLWATGFSPDYSWMKVPVLDRKGYIVNDGGVVSSPGMYLMGMPYMRRRKSALIDGAGPDAYELSAHLEQYLSAKAGTAASSVH